MPTVPTYQDTQQHVALRPEYTEGFTVKADAEAFGAAIGRGMQNAATGLGTLADAVVTVEELDNANAAKDRQTKLGDWQREALHGKNGFLTLTGRAAVEGRAAFEKLAEQKRAEFGKGLRPGAARAYEEATRSSMSTLLDSTIRHTFDQRKAWFAETSQKSIKSSAEDAVAVYNDPAKVTAAIHKGITEIEHQGRMQGWSKEKLARESAQYVSDTTKKVVLRMANESPIKAEQYARTAPGLLPADQTELLKSLEPAVTNEKGKRNAADIIAGLPPTYTGAPDTGASPGSAQAEPQAADGETDNRQPAGAGTKSSGRQAGSLEVKDAGDSTAGTRPANSPTTASQTAVSQNTASQTTGAQTAAPPAPSRQPSGPEDFRTVAGTLAFPGKAKDDVALAGFVKNAAGPSVDPSLKPWLATLATRVLRAAAPAGTAIEAATLASKAFLRFGLPTETPRPGDLVVLGTAQQAGTTSGTRNSNNNNNEDKGHIGFFRGYDADGNILVLGPDPRRAGETALTAHAANQVIGFRTSGIVDEKTMNLPNFNPDGLAAIDEGLNGITDPSLRAATAAQLESYCISQKKAVDANRVQMQEWANNQVIADPNFDPRALPVHIRQAIGPTGMSTLLDYKEKVRAYGQPTTDLHTLYDLQMQFANDPAAFAQIDAFQYRAKLSDKDWEKVTGWQQMAATNQRKARLESLDLTTAFELARPQLEGLGLLNNAGFLSSSEAPRRAALFQTMLVDQMDEFKTINNGQNPQQSDVQKMINRLLLPIVISMPSHGRGLPASETSGYIFEANSRANDASFDIAVQYEDIPRDLRMAIEADLTEPGKPRPTRKQIEDGYEAFILNR